MAGLYTLAAVLTALYVACLFILNLIPHVRVGSIGWWSLCNVHINFSEGSITIKKISLRLNVSVRSLSPFRMVTIHLQNVVMTKHYAPVGTEPEPAKTPQPLWEQLKVDFPLKWWLQSLIIRKHWLNEVSIQVSRLSVLHHALHQSVSVHYAFTKLEYSTSNYNSTDTFVLSIVDAYIEDSRIHSEAKDLKLFHTLEVALGFSSTLSCLSEDKKVHLNLSNFTFLISHSDLQIHDLDSVLAKRKHKDDPQRKIPLLQRIDSRTMMRLFNLIDSIQIEFERSTMEYKEVLLRCLGFSLNYKKDLTSNNHFAKFSWHLTDALLLHLGSVSVDIPSMTYILDIDVSRYVTKSKDESIDVTTTLSLTNPAFFAYFDQLSYLLMMTKSQDRSKTPKSLHEYLHNFVHIRKATMKLVIVDLQGQLHLPKENATNVTRLLGENLIVSHAKCQVLAFKSSSKNLTHLLLRHDQEADILNLKCFIKIKNASLEVGDNIALVSTLNSVVCYCIKSQSIALRMSSKLVQVKLVNTTIFYVIRQLREIMILHDQNKPKEASQDPKFHQLAASSEESPINIFEILPPIVTSVRLKIDRILSYIICNDWLPLHIFYDEVFGEEVDLGEIKRGMSFGSRNLRLNYKKTKKFFEASLGDVEVNTLSDHAKEFEANHTHSEFDPFGGMDSMDASSLESGVSEFSLLETRDDVHAVKQVLNVRDVNVKNLIESSEKLLLSIPEIEGRVDIFLVWCSVYAHSLIHRISPQKKIYKSNEGLKTHNKSFRKIKLDVSIISMSVIVHLPHDVDVMLEVDDLKLHHALCSPKVDLTYFRLYVVHPSTKLWARMVSIWDTQIDLKNISKTSIELTSRSVRFNIPFQYLVYTVIDNAITLFKAARQVVANFSNLSSDIKEYSGIKPHATRPFPIPRIHWKVSTFGITLENDVFEAQLASIFRLGYIANAERHHKQSLFEVMAEKKANEQAVPTSHQQQQQSKTSTAFSKGCKRRPKTFTKLFFKSSSLGPRNGESKAESEQSPSSGSQDGPINSKNSSHMSQNQKSLNSKVLNSDLTNEQEELDFNEKFMERARNKLLEEFSLSWIYKFKKYKATNDALWDERMRQIWGPDEVNEIMKAKFEIQDYAEGYPQFQGVFKDLDLIIDDPHIDDIDEFLRLYGKGQPKTDYSILVPFSMDLRCSSLSLSLRDYSLPLLSFPAADNTNLALVVWRGKFVINEKLISRREEIREIFVPFSPASNRENLADNFYLVNIIRTLSAVKVMFDMQVDVDTDRPCLISWCKSYQAALSSVMMAFENFTKPQIDDSPLGWWDKLSLVAHGKANFAIKNELCLHVKSSLSPYNLVGTSSGFVFCWKDNVSLKINENGIHSELLVLKSDDFILGIPNYSASEGKCWSLLDLGNDNYNEESHLISDKFHKKIMKFFSDEQVIWKLGFLFERNEDTEATELSADMKRTHKFKPHYDVLITGPKYEYHPDSYAGFRSNYTHLAISVNSTSKSGKSQNYAYSTPGTVVHIHDWWNTLTAGISLPIREGKIFAQLAFKESSLKFSPHLFTLKYQLIIDQLMISHVYLASGSQEEEHRLMAYGIKGKASKCVIDLHQRREIARYVNEKLGIDKKIRKLKMNLGEIEVTDADVRMIHAQFPDVSVDAKLLSYYAGESEEPINLETYEQYLQENKNRSKAKPTWMDLENYDMWTDYDDFIETDQYEILSPGVKLEIIPFFHTPKFTYFRESTLEPDDAKYPFGHEPSHCCSIGQNTPEKVQADLVKQRVGTVEQKLRKDKEKLKTLPHEETSSSNSRIQQDIDTGEECIDRLQKLHSELQQKSQTDSVMTRSGATSFSNALLVSFNSSPMLVKTDTAYSAIKSLEQANEVSKEKSLVSIYHNRWLIHDLRMKWNNKIKDTFISFVSVIGEKRTEQLAMSRHAMDLMEKILKKALSLPRDGPAEAKRMSQEQFTSGSDVIEAFDEYMTRLDSDDESIMPKFLIKFIKPQIQILCDADPHACFVLAARDIELRRLEVHEKGSDNIITEDESFVSMLEKRYGIMLKDFLLFSFHEDNFPVLASSPYGLGDCKASWPHWFDIEDIYDFTDYLNHLMIERTTMALSFKAPNVFANKDQEDKGSKIVIQMAKMVINATATQYSSLYFTLTTLLINGIKKSYFQRRLEQIASVSEPSEFASLTEKVITLQHNIRTCRYVLAKLSEKSVDMGRTVQRQRNHVRLQVSRMLLELAIIIRSLQAVGSNTGEVMARDWLVEADQIILHLLENDHEPLIDFALAASKFSRLESEDGSNTNSVEVSLMQGFNLQRNAVYPELLKPFFDSKHRPINPEDYGPMIKMDWCMLNPVGGIQVMSEAELTLQPIHVQLDYDTATKLFEYLFPQQGEEEASPQPRDSMSSVPESDLESGLPSFENSNVWSSPASTFKKLLRKSKVPVSDLSSSRTRFSSGLSTDEDSLSHSKSSREADSLNIFKPKQAKMSKNDRVNTDDIALIMDRSAQYFVVGNFSIDNIEMCISFKAPKHLNIIDMHQLEIRIPTLHYRDKTWSSSDFVLQLKKDLIKIFLSHTGRIIGNKFRHRKRTPIESPLKQILDYSQYMTLQDLENEGRQRDHKEFFPEAQSVDEHMHATKPVLKSAYQIKPDYDELLSGTE